MRSRLLSLPLLILIPLLFVGCGSDGGPSEPPANPVEGATLSVHGAASMARIGVEGLPDPVAKRAGSAYQAVFHTEGAADVGLPLSWDQDGWYFRAPLHPVGLGEGGSLEVRISDGEHESEAQPLDIAPLPEAPGAFARVVQALRTHVDLHAGLEGSSFDELEATDFEAVPDRLLPTKIAQSFVDSADPDDHDLTSLIDDEAGFLTEEERDLLDRLCGYAPLDVAIQAEIDALNENLAGKPALPSSTASSNRRGKDACLDIHPEITTAPELSQAMITARLGEIASDPSTGAGRALAGAGLVLAGGGLIQGLGGPALSAFGVGVAALQASKGYQAGAYPSSFEHIEFTIDKTEFNEDSEEYATYDNVKVRAASKGWVADKDISNIVLTALGGALSAEDRIKIQGSDFLRDAAITDMNMGLQQFLDNHDGVIEICSHRWTIDISSPLYCTAASLNGKFQVDIPTKQIRTKEAGQGLVRVGAQAAQFAGQEIHEDVAMKVKQIQVDPSPDDVYVTDLGQDIQISAEIFNADHTQLRWTPQQGSWNDGLLGSDTNGSATRTLKTPTNEDVYPFFVTIESLSRHGIRASGDPVRQGIVTVRLQDNRALIIDPHFKCISPGETVQFTAEVRGFEDYTVQWSVVDGYGSIDQNGLYQSLGQGTSTAVIEARLAEDAEVYDYADVEVSGCSCSLNINISGNAVWQRESAQVAYQVFDFGMPIYKFWFNIDGSGDPGIVANVTGDENKPAPVPGDTGSWKAQFGFTQGGQSWSSIWDDPKVTQPGVSLNIVELTDTEMRGSFTGNAFQLDVDGNVTSTVIVDVRFRAAYWDGGRWPCE